MTLEQTIPQVSSGYQRLGEIALKLVQTNDSRLNRVAFSENGQIKLIHWDKFSEICSSELNDSEVFSIMKSLVDEKIYLTLQSRERLYAPEDQNNPNDYTSIMMNLHVFYSRLDKRIDRLKITTDQDIETLLRYVQCRKISFISYPILSKKIEKIKFITPERQKSLIELYPALSVLERGMKDTDKETCRNRVEIRLGIKSAAVAVESPADPAKSDEPLTAKMRAYFAEMNRIQDLVFAWIDGHPQAGEILAGNTALILSETHPLPREIVQLAAAPMSAFENAQFDRYPLSRPTERIEDWVFALLKNRQATGLKRLETFTRLANAAAEYEAKTGDDWGEARLSHRALLEPRPGEGDLADYLLSARSSLPTGKWLKGAAELIRQDDAIRQALERWIDTVATPESGIPSGQVFKNAIAYTSAVRPYLKTKFSYQDDPIRMAHSDLVRQNVLLWVWNNESYLFHQHAGLLSDHNETAVRGAAWMLALYGDQRSVQYLRRLAISLLIRLPHGRGSKYRSLIGANACIWSLGQIATPQAVAALAQIKLKVRDERLVKQIAKAMAEAAEKAGMTVDELEEVSVPAFGLEQDGRRETELAGFPVRLAIESTSRVTLAVHKPDGSVYKTPPAVFKTDPEAKAEYKQVQAEAAEIQASLPVQRLRLERSWLTGRAWPTALWHERLHEHPLMGFFTRRLIWRVTAADGAVRDLLPQGDGYVDASGRPDAAPAEGETVALWHPLQATPAELAAWRTRIFALEITQPIRQAFRETYVLTPAEETTATYSNRFAGHILRQHQSMALGKLRGWRVTHRMNVDAPNDEPTRIDIPAHGLRAEFWTKGAGEEMADSQAFIYIATDRTVFHRLIQAENGQWLKGERLPLAQVPPVILSEVMRDIDLMVGVASIGNDPEWLDRGADAMHPNQWAIAAADYARDYGFGELAETAKQRRAVLALLLPKLAIYDRCTLDDRFLTVQGRLHSYRIHLGSGNILMEGDRYLCIVADSAAKTTAKPIYLPFEGDTLLSLILSKAALLAADDKIKDPSILRQIGR